MISGYGTSQQRSAPKKILAASPIPPSCWLLRDAGPQQHPWHSRAGGAFVLAALIVLILGEETKGKMLEAISH